MTVERFDPDLRELGVVLRERRKSMGLRISDVAYQSGLSLAGISRLENGQRLPELKTVMALAETYRCRVVVAEGRVWMETE